MADIPASGCIPDMTTDLRTQLAAASFSQAAAAAAFAASKNAASASTTVRAGDCGEDAGAMLEDRDGAAGRTGGRAELTAPDLSAKKDRLEPIKKILRVHAPDRTDIPIILKDSAGSRLDIRG